MLSSEMHSDLENEIHHLEQQAYGAVLRAFKAQSDALTWEKEGLITELRRELRVSDREHRELLAMVNVDSGGIIRSIREWRDTGKRSSKRKKGPHRIPRPLVANKRASSGRGEFSDSDHTPSQNGLRVLNSGDFEILHTETLLQRIEQVVGASRPDPREIEDAKMILMEHEQALMHAIAKLAEKCDDGSDDEPEMGGRITGSYENVKQQDDDDDDEEILDI